MFLSEEAWLNWTNALLGVAAGVALIAICAAVFHDVLAKVRERARARQHFVFDQHAFHVSDLGLTMADGGEPMDGKPEKN